MKLTKNQQIYRLRKLFGSKADLFDFEAHVDGRLSYEENKRIILSKAKKRGINSKSKLRFKGSPVYYYDKAEDFQERRKLKARRSDNSKTARQTFRAKHLTAEQFFKWRRNPRRYDIIGIDSKNGYKEHKERKLSHDDISKIDIL